MYHPNLLNNKAFGSRDSGGESISADEVVGDRDSEYELRQNHGRAV